MEFKYDAQADAVYIRLNDKQYAYGRDLDEELRIDYAADDTPVVVELLCVSDGVNLDGLPRRNKIPGLLEANGIQLKVSPPAQGRATTRRVE